MIKNCFIISIIFIAAGVLLPTPQLLYVSTLDMSPAYTYMALCVAAFLVSNFALRALVPSNRMVLSETRAEDTYIRQSSILFLLFITVSGVVVLLAQISSTLGLAPYFALIFSASSGEAADLQIQTILVSASEGGYPGFIKMFNWNAVIGPFCLLAMIARGYKVRGKLNYFLIAIIAVAFVARIFLRQDRLSILSLIPVSISIASRFLKSPGQRGAKIAAISGSLLPFAVMVAQSNRRGSDLSMLGWIALYTQVGATNLALMMHSVFQHTYGFWGPLSVFAAIGKNFGFDLTSHGPTLRYVWTDVDNAFGYSYMDVGWFGIGYFLIAGGLARYFDIRADEAERANSTSTIRGVHWILAYATLSLPFVPAYVGIEFWLMLLLVPIIIRLLIIRQQNQSYPHPYELGTVGGT